MTRNIPEYDWSYAHLEWARGLNYFQGRLKQLGFDKREGLFLDAGCGTGQWMDALARMEKEVVGVDVRISRLEIASIFLNPRRTHLVRASLSALPFREDVFDNIICYGVIMFVDVRKTLCDFNRIVRPDTHLYVCWNSLGWSLRLLLHPKYSKRIKIQAIQTILNSQGAAQYFSKRKMKTLLRNAGFELKACDGEGMIRIVDLSMKPVYRGKFLGIDNVLEGLAVNQQLPSSR